MEFQPDYIISWDFSDKDHPRVFVSRLKAEKKATMLTIDVLDTFYSESGVCSLRQLLEEFDAKERMKEEEKKDEI